jgi:hypothetical protein
MHAAADRPAPGRRPSVTATLAVGDPSTRTVAAFGKLIERITSWLLELGTWIFGALIGFNLLILSALLTVGPVDTAVLIATAGVALALPPDIAGVLLLRLAAEMKRIDLEQLATQAFVEVGFEVTDVATSERPDEVEHRRARIILRYSYGLMALGLVLTFIGVAAALWHMAWWIGAAFVGTAIVSQAVFLLALSATGAKKTWRTRAGGGEPRGG